MKKLSVLTLAVVFVVMSSFTVFADGHKKGNNENVKTCKALLAGGDASEAFAEIHGAYPNEVFKNLGQCVSYFANGGFEADHAEPEGD